MSVALAADSSGRGGQALPVKCDWETLRLAVLIGLLLPKM